MKVKLQFKIFAVFSLAAVVIVAFMVMGLRYLFVRHFTEFVNRVEVERLEALRSDLAEAYSSEGGWAQFKSDSGQWIRTVNAGLRARGEDQPEEPPPPAGLPQGATPAPRSAHTSAPDANAAPAEPRTPPAPYPQRLARRLFLLDSAGNLIAGQQSAPKETILQPIDSGGRIVGWLGLRKRRVLHTPLEAAFLQQQVDLFYVLGAGLLAVTALASYLLARNLLAPVRRLASGTQALAARRFETRIAVRSQDELGQLARDFNTMAATLEQFEQQRRQWMSDIAHELRTPLSVLRGEIEAIQDGVRPLTRQQLDSLYAEILRLGKIVEDLHELSLAQSGALTFRKEPVNPLLVLAETLGRYRPRLAQRGIGIQDRLGAERSVTVIGDGDRIDQVFTNLLENEVRYAEAPGTLSVWQEKSSGRWSLFLEDSGPGVPPESVGRLFDRLYRVDSSRSRALGGSGLGLSICKSIVEAMGGAIGAQNAPAGGLRIRIDLPLPAAQAARPER